jgi:predicted small lipoprotein YifL
MKLLPTFSLLAVLICGATLSACGQTGPLYQPPPETDTEAGETNG